MKIFDKNTEEVKKLEQTLHEIDSRDELAEISIEEVTISDDHTINIVTEIRSVPIPVIKEKLKTLLAAEKVEISGCGNKQAFLVIGKDVGSKWQGIQNKSIISTILQNVGTTVPRKSEAAASPVFFRKGGSIVRRHAGANRLFRLSDAAYQHNLIDIKNLQEIVAYLKQFQELIKINTDGTIGAQGAILAHQIITKFRIEFDAMKQMPYVTNLSSDLLEQVPSRECCNKLIIKFYEILMGIPYKYGRVNIERAEGQELTKIKHLVSMGLANLVVELRTQQKIEEPTMDAIMDEMIKQLPIVLENFYFNQQKEEVFSDKGCVASEYDQLNMHLKENERIKIKLNLELAQAKKEIEEISTFCSKDLSLLKNKLAEFRSTIEQYDKDLLKPEEELHLLAGEVKKFKIQRTKGRFLNVS